MRKQEFEVRKAAGQISGIVKTIRYGDHVTVRYWDLNDESDSANLFTYRNQNHGKALIVEILYL